MGRCLGFSFQAWLLTLNIRYKSYRNYYPPFISSRFGHNEGDIVFVNNDRQLQAVETEC